MIYLIRHAQSHWNAEMRIQGHRGPGLSSMGLQQADQLARAARAWQLEAVVSSDLERARQTAEVVAQAAGQTLQVDPDLREIGLGHWEGLTPEEVEQKFPGGYTRWRQSPSGMPIPGMEPFEHFRSRVLTRWRYYLEQPFKRLALVSHGGAIACILSELMQADFDQVLLTVRMDNTGVTTVDKDESGVCHLLGVNDVAHLNHST